MDAYEVLYTTRAMRRVKPDPIPLEVQRRILDAAVRAPTGSNAQGWRFLLVDDPAIKGKLGPLYRECRAQLYGSRYAERICEAEAAPEIPDNAYFLKLKKSADWLAENWERVPLFLFAFCQGDPGFGGSIWPAVWSAMLAARAEGVGSALTSALALRLPQTLEILGVPEDSDFQFYACVSMGYPLGRWGVAPRRPAHEVSFRNQWGEQVGFDVAKPLFEL